MTLRKLTSEVRSKIESSLTITDATQCVLELVENSLDAGATAIAVEINLNKYIIKVIDNGVGMSYQDLRVLGKRFMTSKFRDASDLNKTVITYGYRGQAIPSILDLCSMLSIKTKQKKDGNFFTKTFKNRKASAVCIETKENVDPGTTVTVYDFMSTMPVRRKHLSEVFDLVEIKNQLQYLAVINNKVCFTLRDKTKGVILLQTCKTSNVGLSLSHLFGLAVEKFLVPLNHCENNCEMNGFVSLKKYWDSNFQFFYVNKRIVFKGIIHEVINNLIDKCFKANEDVIEDFLRRQGLRLNIPKNSHNVYVIEMRCPYTWFEIFKCSRKATVEFKNWDDVLKVLLRSVESAFAFSSDRSETIGDDNIMNESLYPDNLTSKEFHGIRLKNDAQEFGSFGSSDRSHLEDRLGPKRKLSHKEIMQKHLCRLVERDLLQRTVNLPSSGFHESEEGGVGSKILPESPIPSERTIRILKRWADPRRGHRRKKGSDEGCSCKYSFLEFLSWFVSKLNRDSNVSQLNNEFVRNLLNYVNRSEESNLISHNRKPFHGIKGKEEKKLRKYNRMATKGVTVDKDKCNSRLASKRIADISPMGSEESLELVRKRKKTCKKLKRGDVKFQNNEGRVVGNLSETDFVNGKATHRDLCDTTRNAGGPKFEPVKFVATANSYLEKKNESEVAISEPLQEATTEFTNFNNSFESWVSHCKESVKYSRENEQSEDVEHELRNSEAMNVAVRNDMGAFIRGKEKEPKWGRGQEPLTLHLRGSFSFPSTDTQKKRFLSGTGMEYSDSDHEKIAHTFQETVVPNENVNLKARTGKRTLSTPSFGRRSNVGGFHWIKQGRATSGKDKSNCSVGVQRDALPNSARTTRAIGLQTSPSAALKPLFNLEPQLKKNILNVDPLNSITREEPCLETTTEGHSHEKEHENVTECIQSVDTPNTAIEYSCNEKSTMTSATSQLSNNLNPGSNISFIASEVKERTSETLTVVTPACPEGSNGSIQHFNFAGRCCFIPKGLSQTLTDKTSVNQSDTNEQYKRELNDMYLNSHDLLLKSVKWVHGSQGHHGEGQSVNEILTEVRNITEENMVFCERQILSTALSKSASKIHGLLNTFSFDKDLFINIKIIGQWDQKFILAATDVSSITGMQVLAIFDQHAVDERIRVEKLLKEFRTEDGRFIARNCDPPVRCVLNESVVHFIPSLENKLIDFGMEASVEDSRTVLLHKVPLCLADEDKILSDDHDIRKFIQRFFIDIVQEFNETRGSVSTIPTSLYNLISTRACRGAIKFNQFLSMEDMKQLIDDLILCQFPFQCAHGRPSVLAVMDLQDFNFLVAVEAGKLQARLKRRNLS